MRLFEVLIIVALLLTFICFLVPRGNRPRWVIFIPSLAALLVLFHLILEGYRWQMVPAYGLAAIAFLIAVRGFLPGAEPRDETSARQRRAFTIVGFTLGLFMLVIATALPVMFPIFSLPQPTGSHAVGTQYYYWTDEDRPDEYTTHRRLSESLGTDLVSGRTIRK